MILSKGIFLNERKSSDYGTWGKPNFRELRKGGNVLGNAIKNESPHNPESLSPKTEQKENTLVTE